MLAQILAIAVALGSSLLFLTAFIFPKLHRQDDFFWSAVGLFYALILWVCAGQMAGAILLAQLASVILLGWFAWETLRLRQAIADPAKIPDLDKVSLVGYVKDRFKPKQVIPPKATKTEDKTADPEASPTEAEATETEAPSELEVTSSEQQASEAPETPETESAQPVDTGSETISEPPAVDNNATETDTPATTPETTSTESEPEKSAEPPITAQLTKKGFSLGRLFGKKSPESEITEQASPPPSDSEDGATDIDEIFGEDTEETSLDPEKITEEEPPVEQSEAESPGDVEETTAESAADAPTTPETDDSQKDAP
jgi:hypothetical protein